MQAPGPAAAGNGVRPPTRVGAQDEETAVLPTRKIVRGGILTCQGAADSTKSRMPEARFELARGCPRWILSPLRLPFRHSGATARYTASGGLHYRPGGSPPPVPGPLCS